MKPVPVLRDRSADLKRLRRLERDGLIEIYESALEEPPNRGPVRVLSSLAVIGYGKLDYMTLASESQLEVYKSVKRIVSGGGSKDSMTLETAIRHGLRVFVTDDVDDFLRHKKRIELQFPGLKLLTVTELEDQF